MREDEGTEKTENWKERNGRKGDREKERGIDSVYVRVAMNMCACHTEI